MWQTFPWKYENGRWFHYSWNGYAFWSDYSTKENPFIGVK